jgi:LysR family transcriptional regulator, low CO2-responsive transcriptional regulator
MRALSLRQLRAFVEVAKAGAIGRAAEALHLTQPAVSMQIRDLERAVGLPVFERIGRGLRLTTTGEYLLVYARRILVTLKEAEDTIARLRGLKGGRVMIGMVTTADHFLPRLLARFRTEHPGIDILLTLGNREQLTQALHAGEVDLAVMGRAPAELGARAEAFAAHPLGVVASSAHPLARRGALPPSALAQEPFIVREPGSGTRAAMEEFFAAYHLSPPAIMQMSSNETIKQAVLADMGLAFLSLHTVAQELDAQQLQVLDVEGLPLMRRWHIVSLPSRTLAPAAEAFRYFVLEEGERLLAALFSPVLPLARKAGAATRRAASG